MKRLLTQSCSGIFFLQRITPLRIPRSRLGSANGLLSGYTIGFAKESRNAYAFLVSYDHFSVT
jgi:hypothetical protein